jgi:tRNA G37 N-methylase Trm5
LLDALKVARESCIIHFYDFLKQEEIPDAALEKISSAVEQISRKAGVRIESYKLIRWKKVGEIGPYKWRVRVDFFVF